ncbi:MAG: hypothetical protein KAT00_05210, partial [Planctomycetes bacterium]|nr:hypothetical protein [Planctomycetota bacterium]
MTIFDADSDGITDEGVIITDIKVDTISVAITGRILLREECTNQWYASSVTTISDNVAKSVTEAGLTWHAITESGDIETGIINGTLLPGGGVGIGNDTLTFGEAVAPPVAVDGGGVYLVDYPTIASHLNGFSWIGDASHGCDVPTEIVADWLGITSGLADNRVDLNTVVNSSSAGLIHSTGPSDDTPGWGGFNNSKIDSNWRIRWINNSVETIAGTALQLQGEANDPGTYLLTRFGQTLPGFNTIRTRFIRGNDRLQWMVRDASDGQWYVSDANDFRGDLDNVIDQWDMTTLNWAPIDSATSAAFSTDVFPDPNTFDLDALTYGTWATVMDGISIDGGGFYIKEATDQLEVNYISFNAIEPGVDNPPTVAISEFFDSPIYLQDYRDNGTVALTANATDENLPALSVLWEVISGPLSYSLTPDDALSISAQFGEVGTYELTCTVDDGVNDPVTSDPVTVEVIDNVAPVVNAGPATALVYLVDGGTLLLDGASVTDDGEPNGVAMVIGWDSGLDTSVSFDDASLVNATATFTEVGEFTLTLTADDTQASDDDSIVVTVEEKLLSTVTVGSIEDSFTAQNDPDANDGARAVVQVRVLTESWAREAYLKFDPGAISGNIRSAELTLQAFGGSRATIVSTDTVYAVTYGPSGEWFEGDGDTTVPTPDTTGVGITWNNDDLVWGDALGSLTSTFPGGTNHTFELSNVVFESDGKITLGVRSDISGTGGSWKSRENLAPQLTIYYDPQQAVEVIPVDEATEVHPGTSLVWQEAVGATAHEVYLGTTSGALGLVDTVPASAKISSDPNLFEWIPSAELDLGVEYFWRIDEVIGGVSIAGEEWSFTVAAVHPDIPTLVSPDDAAIEVACPVELIWNEGFSADSHDIYISDVAPLDVAGLIASGTQITGKDSGYRVPNLNLEATYYWTVVANGAGGPWPSEEVRSFTTAAFANL